MVLKSQNSVKYGLFFLSAVYNFDEFCLVRINGRVIRRTTEIKNLVTEHVHITVWCFSKKVPLFHSYL